MSISLAVGMPIGRSYSNTNPVPSDPVYTDGWTAPPVQIPAGNYVDFLSAFEGTQTSAAVSPDTDYVAPIWIPFTQSYDALQVGFSVAGAVGSLAWIALYDMSGVNGQPTTLLESSGPLAADSTGAKTYVFGASRQLAKGWYYLAFCCSGSPSAYVLSSPAAWAGGDPVTYANCGAAIASRTAASFASVTPSIGSLFASFVPRIGLRAV